MTGSRRWIIGVVVAVVVVLVVVVGAIYLALRPPAEVNQVTEPKVNIEFVRSREDPVLTGYGWADQKNGFARIPVARAIDVVAAKGLPARAAAGGTPTPVDVGQTLPSYSSSGTMPETHLH
jgi:hypothetical protein